MRIASARAEKAPVHVRVEHLPPCLVGEVARHGPVRLDSLAAHQLVDPLLAVGVHLLDLAGAGVRDAGVVDEDVELAERLLHVGEHPLHCRRVGDVGGHGERLHTLQLLRRLLGGLEHEIVDDDVRALGSEAERDRAADAATCAGDERDLVLESHAGARSPGARGGQGLFGFRSTGERENRPHAADSRGCRSRAEESRAKTARERILPLSERAHAARADDDRVRAVDAVALVVR